MFVIDDSTGTDVLEPAEFGRGLVGRDMELYPQGSYLSAPPAIMKVIPRDQWSGLIKKMREDKSRLSDIRATGFAGGRIPSLNQGKSNYCWAHGPVQGIHLVRAKNGLPHVPLSAFAVGCKIQNFKNQGAWSALALDHLTDIGAPDQSFWPQGSFSKIHDTPDCWENAKNNLVSDSWVDLDSPVYDRDLSFDQFMTCLLLRQPVAVDLMWWGHAVLAMDPLEVNDSLPLSDPNRWGWLGLNSWGDEWGENGEMVIKGRKAVPDNAVALKVVTADERFKATSV